MNTSHTSKVNVRKLTITAMFIAIECLLGFTPIGLIPIGAISITLMHIPVIAAALTEDLDVGLYVAVSFGVISMYRAIAAPGLIDQLFRNPLISIVPRLMIPIVTVAVFHLFKRFLKKIRPAYAFAAGAGSIANTVFTLGALSLAIAHNPASVALADRTVANVFILGMWGSALLNAALECAAAVIIVTAIALAIERVRKTHIKRSAQ